MVAIGTSSYTIWRTHCTYSRQHSEVDDNPNEDIRIHYLDLGQLIPKMSSSFVSPPTPVAGGLSTLHYVEDFPASRRVKVCLEIGPSRLRLGENGLHDTA